MGVSAPQICPIRSSPCVRSVCRNGGHIVRERFRRGRAHRLHVLALALTATLARTIAHAQVEPTAPGITYMSSGRLGAIVAGLVALAGVIAGGRALARSPAPLEEESKRMGPIASVIAGLFSIALGALVAATAKGGIGTGNGLGGAIVAMVVGSLSTVLGGLALARTRRAGGSR